MLCFICLFPVERLVNESFLSQSEQRETAFAYPAQAEWSRSRDSPIWPWSSEAFFSEASSCGATEGVGRACIFFIISSSLAHHFLAISFSLLRSGHSSNRCLKSASTSASNSAGLFSEIFFPLLVFAPEDCIFVGPKCRRCSQSIKKTKRVVLRSQELLTGCSGFVDKCNAIEVCKRRAWFAAVGLYKSEFCGEGDVRKLNASFLGICAVCLMLYERNFLLQVGRSM